MLLRFQRPQRNAQEIGCSFQARFLVTFTGLLPIKAICLSDGISNFGIPFLFAPNSVPDSPPCPEQHDVKETLADLEEIDSPAVQRRVDQDELAPGIPGESRKDRH